MLDTGSNIGAVFRHPILLGTFVLAAVGWLTAFIGQCAFEATFVGNNVGVLWFYIWVQLFITVALFLVLGTGSFGSHRLQICCFLVLATTGSVTGVQGFIYQPSSSGKATGAGWLICAFVNLIWLLIFSSEEGTAIHSIFNRFGGGIGGWGSSSGRRSSTRHGSHHVEQGVYPSEHSGLRNGAAERGMSSHDIPTNGGYPMSGYAPAHDQMGAAPSLTKMPVSVSRDDFSTVGQSVDNVTFKHRARANYAYSASPDDPNEVSFAKGDVLEVVDATGKWFQVRTPSGQMGIAPSNYLTLL